MDITAQTHGGKITMTTVDQQEITVQDGSQRITLEVPYLTGQHRTGPLPTDLHHGPGVQWGASEGTPPTHPAGHGARQVPPGWRGQGKIRDSIQRVGVSDDRGSRAMAGDRRVLQ